MHSGSNYLCFIICRYGDPLRVTEKPGAKVSFYLYFNS